MKILRSNKYIIKIIFIICIIIAIFAMYKINNKIKIIYPLFEFKKTLTNKNSDFINSSILILRKANYQFQKANYHKALVLYEKSQLFNNKNNILNGKIQLGIAMSHCMIGSEEEAKRLLLYIFNNKKFMKFIRYEAAYHLSILLIKENKIDKAKLYLSLIEEEEQNENISIWKKKAKNIKAFIS